MRKFLALTLSVILTFSCFVGILTTSAVAAEVTEVATELISNGDFEDTSKNAVGSNMGGIRDTTDPDTLNNGKWYRATGGYSYATYGDLSAYDADTDTVTKAEATEYAKYFTACSTVIAQPDDATNHIGRAQQTLFQAINISDGTYAFKFKVRVLEATPSVVLYLRGLQSNADGKITDSFYDKYTLEVVEKSGDFTYNDEANAGIVIYPTQKEVWTDVELIVKVTEIAEPVSSNAAQSIVKTDFTMLQFYHEAKPLSDATNGKCYRTTGIYLDDISVKAYTNPFGEAEFYKDGKKLENTNEYADVNYTVNGKSVIGVSAGDTVVATPDYNADGNFFAGWYKNDKLVTRDKTLTFIANSTDVYVPKFISKNLLTDTAASFENYADGTSLLVANNTTYPEVGTWGANKVTGYYGATYAETIYDTDGNAYTQEAKNSPEALTNASVNIKTNYAYTGDSSLFVYNNYRTLSTALSVKKNTDYVLSYYAFASSGAKMKGSGIVTTLNIGRTNSSVVAGQPVDSEGNVAESLYKALADFSSSFTLAKSSEVTFDGATWQKITIEFNSKSFEKLYFAIAPDANASFYIDELTLCEVVEEATVGVQFVDTNGNAVADDSNLYASATVIEDLDGSNLLNIDYDSESGAYDFLGWYDADDKCIGTTEALSVTGSTEGIYAKIRNNNLLTYAASYEGYDVDTQLKYTGTDYPAGVYFGGSKNAGYLGQTYEETIYDNKGNAINQIVSGEYAANNISATVANNYVHSGERSVRIANGFWTASMGIEVKPNTDYMLSYYILAPKDVNGVQNTIQLSAIATTLNTGVISNQPNANATNMAINQASTLYLDSKTLTPVHDGVNWVKVTHTFNSMNLSKVYLILGQTSYGGAGNKASWAYIDDMTMFETVPTTMTVDMKSCASLDLIDADIDGLYVNQRLSFKVIENIGIAATVTFNGEASTPDADGVYTVALGETNALSVHFAGDEDLPDYDEDENGRKLSENNHSVYSEAVWDGDTVYHETALFIPDKDTVKLLYPVDSIVSLRSYDLKTNYIEGYDFEITDDGQIKRLEGGRIPVWPNSLVSDTNNGWKRTDGKYVVLTGDTTYPEYAISVTYKHSTTFEDGYNPVKPDSQEAAINNVIKKLENGEEVNIVIYGDSISCGWSSSGLNSNIKIYDDTNTEGNYITRYNINVAPYAPTWIQMLETELKSLYPNATINFKNLALGGKSSPWGAENIAARLALWKDEDGNQVTPDLMLLGFGVNDSSANITSANFKTNMQAIIDNARVASGNYSMEVLMYSPMLPNQDAVNWPASTLLAYEEVMQEIADADINAGLVKLTSIFNEIVKCKDPEDYLNTNLNHGNDFTARVYYNAILAAMESDKALDSIVSADVTFDGVGAAIRKEGEAGKPQAIRVKYDISKAVLGKEYSGYKIVEYGAIVAKSTAYGDELDLGDVQYGKAKKGVAYSEAEGKEIIFASSDTAYTYSLALYNIGAKKDDDGNVTRIDYAEWGTEYSVRAYAIYSAEGKPDLVVYSDEVLAASVFGVMQAIEERGNELDKKYLTDDLLSKEKISTAYNEWKDQIDA